MGILPLFMRTPTDHAIILRHSHDDIKLPQQLQFKCARASSLGCRCSGKLSYKNGFFPKYLWCFEYLGIETSANIHPKALVNLEYIYQ